MNRTKYLIIAFGIVFFLFVSFFSKIVLVLTDWFWFTEVGFQEIFLTILKTKIILAISTFIAVFSLLAANFYISARSKTPWYASLPSEISQKEPITLSGKFVLQISILISAIFGFFFALAISNQWDRVLLHLNKTTFGEIAPVFGHDISFYVFTLPLLSIFQGTLVALTIIALIGSSIIYYLRRQITTGSSLQIKSIYFGDKARPHIGLLFSSIFLLAAFGVYLSMQNLLFSTQGPTFGASYTDINSKLPLLWVKLIAALAAAGISVTTIKIKSFRPIFLSFVLYILIGIASNIYPNIIQKLVVEPNEFVKESPFIERNINATRRAFALDNIDEKIISENKVLTSEDINTNALTVKNIRLWDRQPLLDTFSQIQEIRTYYEFASVDNDRYLINDELRQTMLSPRELDSQSLPSRSFINEYLTFTHGLGVTLSPVNQVTPEGLPVLFVKDIPPTTNIEQIKITRPEIYYGELSNEFVFVNTNTKELDYPSGDENVYTTYSGKGGIEIKSIFRKALFSIRLGTFKIFLTDEITNQSRVMFNRNIKNRIEKVMPFIQYDRDPYMVIAKGKLFWIIDGYTTSNNYPYSQPLNIGKRQINYIRNSLKVVVDAYDGSLTFYIADTQDPIIQTYSKIFPASFRLLSEMPEELKFHIRYPQDIFEIQNTTYSLYHMKNSQVFYNKEDQWDIPAITTGTAGAAKENGERMSPRHLIMRLPDEEQEEYVLMRPFTPRNKDNLSAWMVARSDGENYGKLLVFRFSKQELIFGPKQIMARINQDADISRQITLWDQRGSQVVQGPLLVIPIEESLIYVRPLYLRADEGKIPELKRVIVAYGNKISMEENLDKALGRIFADGETDIKTESSVEQDDEVKVTDISDKDLIRQAQIHFDEAIRAQREGNWALYGRELESLREILQKLNQ